MQYFHVIDLALFCKDFYALCSKQAYVLNENLSVLIFILKPTTRPQRYHCGLEIIEGYNQRSMNDHWRKGDFHGHHLIYERSKVNDV